ncbi:MAG: DUF1553 domain-containing protein [Verrucomicrobiales bacterium]|nr:DUF1553 domain-containing protein [Verrucomicrobiales bacterium]
MKRFLIFLALTSPVFGVDFNRDIRPILSDKCFACHGFDEKERKADLRLDTKEGAFADLGDGVFALVPGKPEESEAWLRIDLDADDEDVMPPKKFHKELTPEEKSLIKQWIKEGAEYETHWSYKPVQRPDGAGKIDGILEKRLVEKGLGFSPQADKITLARRLHFDLLGLPPTPGVVEAFANDDSPQAYEKLVDELLANPAFGERMAVFWLDLVRYADTIGYHSDTTMEVSAYRDYVIRAFNENKPYDQFTIEQLAGDLLPNPTLEQKVASGYNRLLQTTEEGGAQAAEYMVIHAADRVRNVSEVWLGSTIGCAQCHDHKYDPFSQRDFYSLAAFFADVKEKPIGKRVPNLKLPSPEQEKRIAELRKNLEEKTVGKLKASNADLAQKLADAQAKWEAEALAILEKGGDAWVIVDPVSIKSAGGQTLKKQEDFSVLASGKNPAKDNYVVTLKGSGKVHGFRLEALTHDSLVNKSSSRANGNFVLTGVSAKHEGKPVRIASAKADFEQANYPVNNTLDGKGNTGWAIDGHNQVANRVAMFLFEAPIDLGESGTFTVELQHQSGFAKHNIGRFRLSTTDSQNPTLSGGPDVPPNVLAALKIEPGLRDPNQKKLVADHYQSTAPLLADARKNLDEWKKELDGIEKSLQTMLVSEPLPQPRMTRILDRGNWLDKNGEVVQPALPAFLPKDAENEIPEDRRGTRLDLARWIMAESNPLTARTFANRMWKLFFGAGISRDLGDLGGQGQPPTHPELLDFLAAEFRESGWNVKALVKQIVMSEAYRQVSTVSPAAQKADPGNQLFSRQGRWRIEAEFVRDSALRISELLFDEKLGGKSVKPYQPAGYWQHLNFPKRKWIPGKGEELYRRGVYTFWCRTFPHPAMVAFDAPSREECTAERPRSNIPQQALVLLNDPVFVEASRKFGERIAKLPENERVAGAWKMALSREPTAEEAKILNELYASQKARYAADEAAANELLKIGESPAPSGIPASEAAACTSLARAIINAYETTSRF